jgi:hypothetical protein
MLTIYWGFMPAEVRASVRPLLVEYLWMLPTWTQRLYVRYSDVHNDGADGGGVVRAMVKAVPEYRYAELTVYAAWLHDSPVDRRRTIVHEMAHTPHALLGLEAERSIDTLLPADDAPKFREYAQENVRKAVEAATEDWTHAILRVLPGHLPRVPFEEIEDEAPSRPEQLPYYHAAS